MRLAVLVFALVTVVSATRAQPVSERVTRADGVPSDYVLALHQDRWGFVWMGTDAGAVRWDGTRARTFSTDDGLPHPYVTGFAETPDGAFWAATNGGLARQRPDGDWEVVDSPFGRTPVGYLTTDTERRLVISGRATVARREDGLWRSVRTAPRHSSAPVLDVGGGRLLVSGFWEATALLLTPEASGGFRAQRLTVEDLAMEPGRGSFAIYPDAASDDPSRFVGLVDASDDDRVVRLWLDVRRQTLVVTGVARVPGGAGDLAWHDGAAHGAGSAGIRPLNVRTGETGPYLLRAHVRSTLTDREGGLWVGTFGEGAARIMSTHLTVLSEIPSRRIALVGDEAWAFGGAGATHVDLSGAEPLAESWERSGPRSVVAMPDGRFRVSGQAYLFAPLDTPGVIRSLRGQNVFPGTAEDGNWVSGSAETADSLWLGSYGSGVRRFLKAPGARSAVRGSAVRGLIEIDSIGVADGLPTEAVEDVIRTSAGTWAVTRRGLALVRGGRARAMTAEHGLPSSAVFALYEDASGTHWAGTAGGVARLDMTRWRAEAVGETGGRPVVAFVERLAEPGVVYAVTTRGLWRIETGHVEPVDAFPLVRDARTTIEHAMIHGPSDRLILATSAGTALADLSAMPSGAPETPPDVAIVSASVDDAPVELLGTPLAVQLEPLAPGRHRVVIEVAALRFGGTAGVEWREASGAWRTAPEARVVLPDVGPGRHALEIHAVTPGGTASPAATVSFHVAPHWWERSAVRVLAGVLALGVLVGGVRTVSQRRLRARVRELEAAERVRAERERISRDLHDHVGAEVAAILTRAEVARLRATAEGRSADDFHDVETRARRTMGSLREAIWALGLGTLTPEALAGRLGQFAQDQAGPRGPAVDARATGETDRALAPTQALALYRIGQEAVRNAVAHSGGTRLSVIVEATGHRVAVVVRDDGAFGGASGDGGGYGLGNMQARAEALGGTFAVTNGSGTTVRAEIPVA